MRIFIGSGILLPFLIPLLFFLSCATYKVAAKTEERPQPVVKKIVEKTIPPPPAEEKTIGFDYNTLYFDFDRADILLHDRAYLDRLAEFLIANETVSLIVAGHADERGSLDYNLSLGEQRAFSVRDALQRRGIAPERIRIISYGEERPAAYGRDESAYAKNRRAEFDEIR